MKPYDFHYDLREQPQLYYTLMPVYCSVAVASDEPSVLGVAVTSDKPSELGVAVVSNKPSVRHCAYNTNMEYVKCLTV